MLKKTIEYTDYNGEKCVEDFYFNLTKTEISKMELSYPGGLSAMLKKIIDAKDNPTLIKLFEDLILKSYGVKSEDGKRFMKGPDIARAFSETPAFDILFMELATDDKAATAFVTAIIPSDVSSEIKTN